MIKNLIVAVSANGGIGVNNTIPWTCVPDIKRFASITKGSAVIMGRKTWDSLGKPLDDRLNIVVSASGNVTVDTKYAPDIFVVPSIDAAIKTAEMAGYKELFFIGGSSIYDEVLSRDLVDTVYLTLIKGVSRQNFDRYFKPFYAFIDCGQPNLDRPGWVAVTEKQTAEYAFYNFYRKRTNCEHDKAYLQLLNEVLQSGTSMPTRVGPAKSIFGTQLKFDMREGLPIITTKKMMTKAIITELCWFLKGSKNIHYLNEHGVHIWDKDAYAHFQKLFSKYDAYQIVSGAEILADEKYFPLASISFDMFMELVKAQVAIIMIETHEGCNIGDIEYTFGDVGPIYGAQWLNFNNSGINQIDALINTLRRDPLNRRLVVSAWNPEAMPNMALPPCHYAFELYTEPIPREYRLQLYADKIGSASVGSYVSKKEFDRLGIPAYYLSLRWIQRSCDMALGVPFDIASYAILLSIICNIVNMIPKYLIGSLGNTHIYEQHIPNVIKQLRRNPYLFAGKAFLKMPPQVNAYKDLEPEMISIENYKSYPSIKFDLFTDASKQS